MNLSTKAIEKGATALATLNGLQFGGLFPDARRKYERHATAVLAAAGPTLVADQVAVLDAVDALHIATGNGCKSCTSQAWPCDTRQALDAVTS